MHLAGLKPTRLRRTLKQSLWARYLVAIIGPLAAFVLNDSIRALMTHNQFALYLAAVAIAAWATDWVGSLLAALVSTILLTVQFFPPDASEPTTLNFLFRLGIFAAISSLLAIAAYFQERSEEQLESTEETFRLLLENARDYGIFFLDTRGHVMSWNSGAERLFGYVAEEIIGQPSSRFFTPEDLANGVDQLELKQSERTGRAIDDRWHIRKDGSRFFANGMLFPLRDARGHTRGHAKILRDQTERKHAEDQIRSLNARLERRVDTRTRQLRQSQEQINQLQRLDAIGRLAGGVAHDFNNIITAILGTAEEIRETMERDPRREDIGEIIEAAKRAMGLTRQLLAFSRRQTATPVLIDLNASIVEMNRMIRRLIGEDITLNTDLDASLWMVEADRTQLEQAVMNIVVNAREAMPRGGRLTVETSNMIIDDAFAKSHPGTKPGSFVMLSITDTGHGIDAQTQARIFEPFFSTKGTQGTGLGLATVYGIVKQNGGSILVESEVDKGTTFRIFWPRAEMTQPRTPTATPPTSSAAEHGSETVLVVEDETLVRRVITRALGRRGYKVLEASDGHQALAVCRQYTEPIHLLVTDVVMPGLNGRQVAEMARRIHPEMKTLYTSGYTADIIASRGLVEPGIAFIEKSFTGDSLAHKVRQVLDTDESAEPSSNVTSPSQTSETLN